MKSVKWKSELEDHDYPGAVSFLSLLCSPSRVEKMIPLFHKSPVVEIKAKDVIRASRLPLLAKGNFHVAKDMKRIANGTALSPLLLVRGDEMHGVPLTIADGYHRACAVYWNSEDDVIQARIIDWKM
jgi:hypothetical protein